MLILKIGGSLFAPKNKKILNLEYLKKINEILKNYKGQIVIVHGTGNFGHGFVKKYGISKKTYSNFLKLRNNFYKKIDECFPGFKRILARKINKIGKNILKTKENLIIGGDILNKSLKIISSDVIFGKLIGGKDNLEIILTDVKGVLDKNKNLIKKVNLNNLENIDFWQKKNDITNSMKGKLLAIKEYLNPNSKGVFLASGYDLDNFKKILKKEIGEGTLLVKE